MLFVDFHVHTSLLSGCASSSPKDQVESAIGRGIDCMFITEHMQLFPQDRIDALNEKYAPFRVYQGIEVTVRGSSWDDFVVIGVHDKAIEGEDWTYRDLWHFVKARGGAIILAHPYRYSDKVEPGIFDLKPDAVEVLSSNIGTFKYEKRLELAEKLGVPVVTNSDSHHVSTTGCYSNRFPDDAWSEELIVDHLLAGKFEAI